MNAEVGTRKWECGFAYELSFQIVRLLNVKPPADYSAMPVLVFTIFRANGMMSATAFIGLN